jgi:hypothetical protein
VREDVHPGRVPPDEEGLVVGVRPVDRAHGPGQELLVHGLHRLLGQRAGVLDPLLADAPELRVLGRVVVRRRPSVQDAAGAEPLAEVREPLRLGVVRVLRLLLALRW